MALLALLAACGKEQAPPHANPSTASADEIPFVVFLDRAMVIDRVGAVVRVPAAVGSTVSAQTISSSDPSVVEVTGSGELRARARGRATIRATGNPAQVLQVDVRDSAASDQRPSEATPPSRAEAQATGRLSIHPTSADLRTGDVVLFEVAVGGQRLLPQWRFEGPALLLQSAPSAFVAARIGRTKLCAASAQQSVCASVVVGR